MTLVNPYISNSVVENTYFVPFKNATIIPTYDSQHFENLSAPNYEYTITINANPGYMFDENVQYNLRYRIYDNGVMAEYVKFFYPTTKSKYSLEWKIDKTLFGDRDLSKCHIEVETAYNVMFELPVDPNPPKPKFVLKINNENDLVNCSCNYSNLEELKEDKPLLIKANEGYKFNSNKTFYVGYDWGGGLKLKYVDETTLELNPDKFTENIVIDREIKADSKEPPKHYFKIEKQLVNCSCNYSNQDELLKGKDLIIKANDNAEFESISYYASYERGTSIKFSNPDNKTLTIKSSDFVDTIIIDREIKAVIKEPPKYYLNISGSFVNCSCNYKNGDIIKDNIILTPNTNYRFLSDKSYSVKITETGINAFFDFVGDNLVLDVSKYPNSDIEMPQVYQAYEKPSTISGFVNLYKMTNDKLKELSKIRFRHKVGEGTNAPYDYGTFITNVYNLPFKIPTEIIGQETPILLADLQTNINSNILLKDNIELTLCNIEVPPKYNNVYDYINTNVYIHLPFTDKIELDVHQVIGKTITVKYAIDLYSGISTIKVFNNESGLALTTHTINTVQQLPYIIDLNKQITKDFLQFVSYKPEYVTIEVVRNTPYNNNTYFGKTLSETNLIKNYKGFIKIDNIDLSTLATKMEVLEIKQLLNEGVIINENISIS